ncbi:MAG: four helix bundle protein [Planctomycetota bacterium]|jgi:four helix bundle protein
MAKKAGKEKGQPFDLRDRTLEFGARILKISAGLPESTEARIVRRQLTEAATSIGANVEEADGAATKADKKKNLTAARREARQTGYWLRIIERTWPQRVDVQRDSSECSELINILSTIIDKLR